MNRSVPVTLTNMCMVYDGDHVLVQDRTDSNWPGITFPSGHVESGESFAVSIIREVFEETGLTIQKPRLCGVKEWENADGSRYMVLLYKTNLFSGQLKSSDEGDVFWTTLEKLPFLKLSEGFAPMLQVFLRDDLSEYYFEKTSEGWRSEIF